MNTQVQAYESVQSFLPALRDRVLAVIKSFGEQGATIEEIARSIPDAQLNAITPRPGELAAEGFVTVIGTRKNSRNRNMKVWAALNGFQAFSSSAVA